MATQFLSCSFFFLFAALAGQAQNLFPNSDFEEYENGCPENLNDLPVGWNRWRGSGDSFHTCVVPETWEDSLGWAPLNGFGYQIPFNGESYVGLCGTPASTADNYREYLGCELISPLEIDEVYTVSMYVSLAYQGFYYNPTWACNNLGFYFTTEGDYDWEENPLEIPNASQVYSEEVITDHENWTLIEGSFVADQAYTHAALGVFFEDEFVEQVSLDGVNSLVAYYFIDGVELVKAEVVGNTFTAEGRAVSVYPNPATREAVVRGVLPNTAVQLYSMTGVQMGSWLADGNELRIATSYLPSGTYIVHISGENYATKEKLVIVH